MRYNEIRYRIRGIHRLWGWSRNLTNTDIYCALGQRPINYEIWETTNRDKAVKFTQALRDRDLAGDYKFVLMGDVHEV